MNICDIESVQLYSSTDESIRNDNCFSAQTPHTPIQAPGDHWPTCLERFSYRTVHPLREARMQMRRNSRTRSQILSIGQLPGPHARTRVRIAEISGSGKGIPRQLSEDQSHPRGDLLYQPRVVTTTGEVVENDYGHPSGGFHFRRHRRCSCRRGEYASIAARRNVCRKSRLGGNG